MAAMTPAQRIAAEIERARQMIENGRGGPMSAEYRAGYLAALATIRDEFASWDALLADTPSVEPYSADLMEVSGGEPERYLAMAAEMEADAGLRPSVEPAGQSVRYATGLTGAAYNLLGAIEYGDRANVHRWSVALRQELDAYFLPTQASDSPEKP